MRDMKDSGVEWIGKIPENWECCKLKRITSINTGCTPSKNEYDIFYDKKEGIPWIKVENLGSLESINITEEYLTLEGAKYARVFPKNAVYVCCIASIGKVGFSEIECSCNQQINVLLFERAYWKYGFYLTIAQENEYIHCATGNVVKILNSNRQADIVCTNPPLEEQQKIANYLDEKCAKVDAIIEKQQAIIEKLKEYKLSVITEAVTKGLNPNVEMKDSGIEWTEQIPTHWSSMKLKYCTYVRARLGWKGLKAEEYVEEGYPLLSAFNIVNSKLDFRTNINYINQIRYDESPEIKLCLGDILLVKDGAGIGKCAIVEELPLPSTTNGSLAVITTDEKIVPKYLYYYFLSAMFQKYIDRLKAGMGVPHLFQADIKEIQVVIPSPMEQQEIVEELDNKIKFVDFEITKIQTLLGKYKEYKSSLIYEVVTGKREV